MEPLKEVLEKFIEENFKNVYLPEFVPYYPKIAKENGLSYLEGLLYGFIRFFTKATDKDFYFSNRQLAELFDRKERIISHSINKLIKSGLIISHYEIKAGGGKMRFLKVVDKNT